MKEINRRDFLKIMIGAIGGLMSIIVGWPLIASIMQFFFQEKHNDFIKVPGFSTVPLNQMTNVTIKILQQDSFFLQPQYQDVWVIKHGSDSAEVFSPICTHLACQVNWQGDWQKFVCPCHGSVFNADGRVVSGPAPRSLDTLPSKIEGGELYVQWKIYKAGIAKKIEI